MTASEELKNLLGGLKQVSSGPLLITPPKEQNMSSAKASPKRNPKKDVGRFPPSLDLKGLEM
jgi:hypothetical protein